MRSLKFGVLCAIPPKEEEEEEEAEEKEEEEEEEEGSQSEPGSAIKRIPHPPLR